MNAQHLLGCVEGGQIAAKGLHGIEAGCPRLYGHPLHPQQAYQLQMLGAQWRQRLTEDHLDHGSTFGTARTLAQPRPAQGAGCRNCQGRERGDQQPALHG
ncbi:hypothetical protein SDC9_179103 [bioreactor metagenome]|uniref:Uncharacterized protein n=1 Tax=bioreactor metagenome TaxID=1076179 RepID=A0A645H0W9_9ZZZZ